MFLVVLSIIAMSPDQPSAFMRSPDIFGDRVVFTCEGDLWLGDITTGRATRITRDEGTETDAHFSPDGTLIAFTGHYSGMPEVYVMPATGGAPVRITYSNDRAEVVDWTPDGKSIIFRARQAPAWWAMFTVPVDGGYPVRLPLEFASHLSMAPDGDRFVFTRISRAGAAWYRYQGGQKNDIWVGDLTTKEFRKVYETRFSNEYPVWAGERLCFVNDSEEGFRILSTDPGGRNQRLLAGPSELEIRELGTDGERLIYERGVDLEIADLASGRTMPVRMDLDSDLMHTLPYLAPADRFISAAHLGRTGKRILMETRGQILSVPASKGDVRLLLAKDGVRYRLPTFSPDASKIAYISDETREQQLYIADPDGSNPRQMTHDSGRQLVGMVWSPDGRMIALSDSNTNLRLVNVETGDETVVTKGTGSSAPYFSFSPDSKWIAHEDPDRFTYYNSIGLYDIVTKEHHRFGTGLTNDWRPTFSTDGKWLIFISRRNIEAGGDEVQAIMPTHGETRKVYLLPLSSETASPFLCEDEEEAAAKQEPEKKEGAEGEGKDKNGDKKDGDEEKPKGESKEPQPVRIDLEGLYDRQIELPVGVSDWWDCAVVGDRVLLMHGNTLTYYDLKDKKSGTVAGGVDWFQVSDDNKKLMLYAGDGGRVRVVDVTAKDVGSNDSLVSLGNFQLHIDPRAEWENMYWDAWRLARDYFYVANMHGNDWPAVGEKYAKLLPCVRSRGELNELIRFLYSELCISHIGVGGGDSRGSGYRGASPAYLGVDLEPDPSGYYKITNILTGDSFSESDCSPLAAPGLKVKTGDYLIEVAGVPAKVGEDFMGALVGRAGQVVALKVNDKPAPEGARTIHIKPMGSDWRLRYYEWVKSRRAYVDEASGGKIGYIHIPDMGGFGMSQFLKQYYPQRNKDALIVDERFNGGGYISTMIINVLKQKMVALFNSRANPQPWTRQGDYFPGPMCCMMNEFSGSNGEEFPQHFRALGLGPLIGRRTWGGEVGSDPGWPLADGGKVWIPNYGAYTPKDGWIIEGVGVKPDYDVESDPNAWVEGHDAQLDKAVEVMQEALKKNPVVRYTQPPDPVKVKRH
jgi:tricorn protease